MNDLLLQVSLYEIFDQESVCADPTWVAQVTMQGNNQLFLHDVGVCVFFAHAPKK